MTSETVQTAETTGTKATSREVALEFSYAGKRGVLRLVLGGRYGGDSLAAAQAAVQALQSAALMAALIAAGDGSPNTAFRLAAHEADLRRAVSAADRLAAYAAEEN